MSRLLPLVLLVTLAGCNRFVVANYKQSRPVMGTNAEVSATGPSYAAVRDAVEAAYARFDDVNRLMSDYVDDSEIGRLNQLDAGESLEVSNETFTCLQRGRAIAEQSGGAFDFTCRPLIELWKAAAEEGKLPSDANLADVRSRVGWQKLTLDPNARSATPTVAGMQIDLGGIAKGYALDLAAEAMKNAGASGGLVNVGGDVVAFGRRSDGQTWTIGVQHPFANRIYAKLHLSEVAVATSGVQQRFFEIDGQRYSHIVDPRTGRPATQAPSVTVIAPDGLTADAWATALSVLTVEEGKKLAETLDGVEVLWLTGSADDLRIAQTPGFADYVIP